MQILVFQPITPETNAKQLKGLLNLSLINPYRNLLNSLHFDLGSRIKIKSRYTTLSMKSSTQTSKNDFQQRSLP